MAEVQERQQPSGGSAGSERGLFSRLALFIRQVIAELRKVIWPTRKELNGTTVLELPIEEASAKIRTGGPIDDEDLLDSAPEASPEDYYLLGLLAYLAGDFDAADAHLARADADMVEEAARILDDPSFGAGRQGGLK